MRPKLICCSCVLAVSTIVTVSARQQPGLRKLVRDDHETSSSSSSLAIPLPLYTNSSISSTTSSDMTTSSDSASMTSLSSSSAATPNTASDSVSVTGVYSDDEPPMTPPVIPTSAQPANSTITSPPSLSSNSSWSTIDDNITGSNCSGILRIQTTPVLIVTETITEEFTVTVTAANQSLTTPPIEYPLPPCTVIFSSVPILPVPPPALSTTTEALDGDTPMTITAPVSSRAGFTSTVYVTSKTPVPFLQTPTIPQYGNPTGPAGVNNPPIISPPDFGGDTSPTPSQPNPENEQPGNNDDNPGGNPPNNDDGQSSNNRNGQNNNNNNNNGGQNNNNQNGQNNNNNEQGGPTEHPDIGAIIASIINQPWRPRPTPSPPENNGNPLGARPGSPPGDNNRGSPAPVNPGAIISNILRLSTANPPAPAAPTGLSDQRIPILIGPSDVVIGNQVVPMPGASDQPRVVVVNGQSYTVEATAVVGPYMTLPLPAGANSPGASTAPVVVNGVPVIMVGTTQVIISGQTYSVGPSAEPTTIVINGQTISVGSNGVGFASTTLVGSAFTTTAVAGVSIGIGASQVVVSGTTYDIGPSATPTTIVVNGQTISVGPSGIGFTSTTLAVPNSAFTTTAVSGVTLSVGSSQVVISGTTFNIGPSATPTTITVNGQTISIGPSGVGFASTTISPADATAIGSAQRTTASSMLPSRTGEGDGAAAAASSSGSASSLSSSSSSILLLGPFAALLVASVLGLVLL